MSKIFPPLGHRGRVLLLLSLVWVLVGVGILNNPDPDPRHTLPLELLPEWAEIGLWWCPAGIAVVTAWWPPGRDKWGFAALVVPAALRAFSYGITVAVTGWWKADPISSAVAWATVTALIVLLSDWPEEARRRDSR